LHEAQLNFKLLAPLGIKDNFALDLIKEMFAFTKINPLEQNILSLIDKNKINLILHPKSKGSALEWEIPRYIELIKLLPKEKFKVFVTGTIHEKIFLSDIFVQQPEVIDMTGKLDLSQLISFINSCQGLIAASTGPLHIASILNKNVIGLYPSVRPIHPGRWAPIGENAHFITAKMFCENCRTKKNCDCMSTILPQEVAEILLKNS
jgi:ADP-heptose:LPS heptosyltransferase